jgi:hypothetical protein
VGAAVSTVMVSPAEAAEALPAVSVDTAVMVWLPWLSAPVVKLQPPAPAVTVPSSVAPSYSVTVLPFSAVPLSVGVVSAVMLSLLTRRCRWRRPASGVPGVAGATGVEHVGLGCARCPGCRRRRPP